MNKFAYIMKRAASMFNRMRSRAATNDFFSTQVLVRVP